MSFYTARLAIPMCHGLWSQSQRFASSKTSKLKQPLSENLEKIELVRVMVKNTVPWAGDEIVSHEVRFPKSGLRISTRIPPRGEPYNSKLENSQTKETMPTCSTSSSSGTCKEEVIATTLTRSRKVQRLVSLWQQMNAREEKIEKSKQKHRVLADKYNRQCEKERRKVVAAFFEDIVPTEEVNPRGETS